jgi:hypothetical protein
VVQEHTSPEDPKFLCHLNRDLDRDKLQNSSKTLLKEKERKRKRKHHEGSGGSARWHGNLGFFVSANL